MQQRRFSNTTITMSIAELVSTMRKALLLPVHRQIFGARQIQAQKEMVVKAGEQDTFEEQHISR